MLYSLISSGASFRDILIQLLLTFPVVVFSLSVHEYAHGWVAMKCGDRTAYNMGRLTLNPLKHLDPIGTLCLLLFGIGWARPVQVNSRNFKKPRRDMALVAAAGPAVNLITGIACAFICHCAALIPSNTEAMGTVVYVTVMFFFIAAELNIFLAVFNLLPIPPFDGSRIFFIFLPVKWYFGIMKYERYIRIVLLILLWFGFLTGPLQWLSTAILNLVFKLIELIPVFPKLI